MTLPFEHATLKIYSRREEENGSKKYSRNKGSSGITSNNSDQIEVSVEEYFAQYAYRVTEGAMISKCLEMVRSVTLASIVFHLHEISKRRLCECLLMEDVITWFLKDLRPTKEPVRHFPELNASKSFYSRPRNHGLRHNELVRGESYAMMEAETMVPAASTWSFPVEAAIKQDGKPSYCVYYNPLNRVMKEALWPFPYIEESFDDLVRTEVFTTLDLLSGHSQIHMTD